MRFAPPSALVTPELIERACSAYTQAIRDGHTDPLLAIAMFILDFTCIHPFNDGNGRMSQLLTLLMLYRNGYMVGKYISIEHLIEQSKSTYYEALAASTQGWDDNANDYAPFTNYLLWHHTVRVQGNLTNASISRQAAERRSTASSHQGNAD